MRGLKQLVKSAATKLGWEVRRFAPSTSEAAQLRAMLAYQRVNVIFDVGANVGQYAGELRGAVGYQGRIVSFEPVQKAHEELLRAASKDLQWAVAPRVALGSTDGTININVAGNSQSSSVLAMLDTHTEAFPESRFERTETVPLRRLDTVALRYLGAGAVPFLKIDTQGYEREVLAGGPQLLARTVGVQLEVSLVPLYAGQAAMSELVNDMLGRGFDLWSLAPTIADPRSGRMLQMDATFFRRELRDASAEPAD